MKESQNLELIKRVKALVSLCKITGGKIEHGFDMGGAAFFKIDALPELSEDRILSTQIHQLYAMIKDKTAYVYYD